MWNLRRQSAVNVVDERESYKPLGEPEPGKMQDVDIRFPSGEEDLSEVTIETELFDRPRRTEGALQVGTLGKQLLALRGQIALAAQQVVDAWEQDEEGLDPELGSGGICDRVSEAIAGVVNSIPDEELRIEEGGQEGDDHAYLIVLSNNEAYEVDIPPGVYEVGGGYSWRKRHNVKISPEDVIVSPLPRSYFEGSIIVRAQISINELERTPMEPTPLSGRPYESYHSENQFESKEHIGAVEEGQDPNEDWEYVPEVNKDDNALHVDQQEPFREPLMRSPFVSTAWKLRRDS